MAKGGTSQGENARVSQNKTELHSLGLDEAVSRAVELPSSATLPHKERGLGDRRQAALVGNACVRILQVILGVVAQTGKENKQRGKGTGGRGQHWHDSNAKNFIYRASAIITKRIACHRSEHNEIHYAASSPCLPLEHRHTYYAHHCTVASLL